MEGVKIQMVSWKERERGMGCNRTEGETHYTTLHYTFYTKNTIDKNKKEREKERARD